MFVGIRGEKEKKSKKKHIIKAGRFAGQRCEEVVWKANSLPG